MPYRDTWATCENCGKQFVFRVEEQRRLDEMGFDVEPSLCPDCQRKQDLASGGEHQGVVKWYDPEKRYGFITQRGGEDIFFHRNDIAEGQEPKFPEGTPVTFRVEEEDKGPKAVDVARAES